MKFLFLVLASLSFDVFSSDNFEYVCHNEELKFHINENFITPEFADGRSAVDLLRNEESESTLKTGPKIYYQSWVDQDGKFQEMVVIFTEAEKKAVYTYVPDENIKLSDEEAGFHETSCEAN